MEWHSPRLQQGQPFRCGLTHPDSHAVVGKADGGDEADMAGSKHRYLMWGAFRRINCWHLPRR